MSEECFVEHTGRLLRAWEVLKPKYFPTLMRLSRALGKVLPEALSEGLKGMLVFHDVGKLTEAYRQGEAASLRHEFVSGYLFYEALRDFPGPLRLALTGAVLLHHEPILMGQVERIGEKWLTATEVWRRFRAFSGGRLTFLDGAQEAVLRLLSDCARLKVKGLIPKAIEASEIANSVARLILMLRHLGKRRERIARRMVTGAFLTTLVLCDYYAAAEVRDEDRRLRAFWSLAVREFDS